MSDDTSKHIQIAPMAEEFVPSYHKCLDAIARERRYLAFVQAPPLESSREFVLTNIANGAPAFVALRGDEVVGWCDITPTSLVGFTHCGRLGMGIRKDLRRRGIGRRLIQRTLSEAQERGLERIELEVLASNTPAIKLYEKMGFVLEGVKKKARNLDGAYDDLVQMALFI
jgi:ribosomal protein S18 acetylase RimI-like enzyme